MKNLKRILVCILLTFYVNLFAQEITITGIVYDQKGLIPGANIWIKGTNTGTQTDFDGTYSIKVKEGQTLIFSYIGMKESEIKIEKTHVIDVVLEQREAQKFNSIIVKKPVIYLYPTQKTDITFQLDFKGKLLTTFPKYDKEWQVTAFPDGKILDKKSNRYYTSLFWDGEIKFPQEHYDYKSGFEVSKNDLNDFLIEKLEYLGLNVFETNDFIQYWLPILEKNEVNFIHFLVNEDYDVISTNNINPKPNSQIRIFMEFYKLENKTNLPAQVLKKLTRNGFTLIEWGGADVSDYIKLKL